MQYPRIRALRESKNLTQNKVAKYLNISPRTYSRYENGTGNIPTKIAMKLARYYDTSVDYLVNMTDEKKPHKRK